MTKIRLTPRRLEMVKLIAQGKLYKEIAFDLGISVKTVETMMQNAQRDNGCNIHRLLILAERQGLLKDVP